MKILLFGCQRIANSVIEFITETEHELVAVVTHDEERDRIFSSTSVSELCFNKGIPSIRFDKKIDVNMLSHLEPDIIFSVYYRKILSKDIIDLPKLGCINIHPGLLPLDRGPNPTYWNVRRGDTHAGATLHYINKGMDTGDLLAHRMISVNNRTGYELNEYMMDVGLQLFKNNFDDIMKEECMSVKQDNSKATCNIKYRNNFRYIDWCQPAEDIVNHVRAHASPYGRSITKWKKYEFCFDKLEIIDEHRPSEGPGSFKVVKDGIVIQTHTKPVFARTGTWGGPMESNIVFIGKGRFISGVPE